MARGGCAEAGSELARQTRAKLESDPEFAQHFAEAKALVAAWDVQFIEVDDPLVRRFSRSTCMSP